MRRPFDISSESTRLDDLAAPVLRWCTGVAAAGLGGAVIAAFFSQGGLDRLLQTYLVSFTFVLSLALGGLFFVLLQHVTRAGWSVVVRRVAEGMAGTVVLGALTAIPVVLGMSRLYHWMHPHGDPVLEAKTGYLNPVFFVIRLAVYFAVWGLLARTFLRRSTEQDTTGDPALTVGMERLSAPGIVLFAVTLNFAAFDLLMSLDPHWFSTIFGVYYFSGSVVGFLAAAPVALVALQRAGRLRHAVSVEHYHDLGKLLFAFIVFWAYIAFSQYMLIWYGNLPEETEWFLKRQSGGWAWVSLALLFGHFVIPFLALLSRFIKRRPMVLAGAGVWMLAMHWLDLYWLVMPEFSPDAVVFGPVDVLCLAGLLGLFVGATVLWLRRHPLLPERDPRLSESLAFENV